VFLVEKPFLLVIMTPTSLFLLASTVTIAMAAGDVGSSAVQSAASETVVSKGFLDAFFSSFGLILVSEIGDETFIIAALMAMQHPRMTVFAGAFGALVIMTVLSTGLGIVLPSLISRQTVRKFACVLYTAFGLRLLWIAYNTNPMESGKTVEEEIKDVEAQLNESQTLKKLRQQNGTSLLDDDTEDLNEKSGRRFGVRQTVEAMFENVLDPVFLEALILTFLAEWGDRSQLATIALATHYNAIGVTIGGVLGHCICTIGAVTGGKMLAMKISPRPVALFGGITFLACAYYAYAYGESPS